MNQRLTVQNIQTDTESGSYPFLIVETNDSKKYQVKLPNYQTSSMINEYIAHKIADKISAKTPKGDFIKFNDNEILDSIDKILLSKKFRDLFEEYDLKQLKNSAGEIILFGMEWLEDISITAESKEEFNEYLKLIDDENIYTLFSYDLYLHNHDRHLGNILFYPSTENNYVSILIDHDRIFGTNEGIQRITELKNDFECIRNSLTDYLYEGITTVSQKEKITDFSKDIEKLEDSFLEDLFSQFLEKCNPSILKYEDVLKCIEDFLKVRRIGIVNAVIKNCEGTCYG